LGISTCYLAAANPQASVHTLEGDTHSLAIAKQMFQRLKLENINTVAGKFKDTLTPALKEIANVDFVFIDGHHDKDATLNYFNKIKEYCHNDSVIIIDDIYWSKGMEEAWGKIKEHSEVSLSIDLFFCGIVFFRKENKQKEHFKIRPDRLLFHIN
jgi:predicted O-methyltransferase YrrM